MIVVLFQDGHKLCSDLVTLIQERADIEKHYAKSLKAWSTKWNGLIEKGMCLYVQVYLQKI